MKITMNRLLISSMALIIAILSIVQITQSAALSDRLFNKLDESVRAYSDVDLADQVQTAVSLADMYYKLYESGELTYDEMIEQAKQSVISLRYNDGGGYFWIDDKDYICVAHPVAANVGLYRYDYKDANGVYYIRLLLQAGDAGGGFSEFSFPRIDSGDQAFRKRAYTLKYEPLGWYISTGLYQDDLDTKIEDIRSSVSHETLLIILSAVAMMLAAVAVSAFAARKISNPIRIIGEQIELFAHGNFELAEEFGKYNPKIREFRLLAGNAKILSETLHELTRDLNQMSISHFEGRSDAKMNEAKFEGEFKLVSVHTNNMVRAYIDDLNELLDCLNKIVQGDFNITPRVFNGDRSRANTSISNLIAHLRNISAETSGIIAKVSQGDFGRRVGSDNESGDWATLLKGLDNLVYAVERPIGDIVGMLDSMAGGDFGVRIENEHHGVFLHMKNAANDTVAEISSYVREISALLNGMANEYNYQTNISGEYKGDFKSIKTSINAMITGTIKLVSTIKEATSDLFAGISQISASMTGLIDGVEKQTTAVTNLNTSVAKMESAVRENTEKATNAASLVSESRENAAFGEGKMRDLISKVSEVVEQSNQMREVMKTLNNIAFQTNLLALNASVEAARAGVHGKGFAVVAEEVRNLSNRSQASARRTSELIDSSLEKIGETSTLAGETMQFFSNIADGINSVTSAVGEIKGSSSEQAAAISAIRIDADNINKVSLANSALSEELYAVTEQLSNQTKILSGLIEKYRI